LVPAAQRLKSNYWEANLTSDRNVADTIQNAEESFASDTETQALAHPPSPKWSTLDDFESSSDLATSENFDLFEAPADTPMHFDESMTDVDYTSSLSKTTEKKRPNTTYLPSSRGIDKPMDWEFFGVPETLWTVNENGTPTIDWSHNKLFAVVEADNISCKLERRKEDYRAQWKRAILQKLERTREHHYPRLDVDMPDATRIYLLQSLSTLGVQQDLTPLPIVEVDEVVIQLAMRCFAKRASPRTVSFSSFSGFRPRALTTNAAYRVTHATG